jgi:CheY-like chemotaxis protein
MGTDSATNPRVERRQNERAVRVLVVDDEGDTVTALKTIVESEGHAVEGVLARDEVPP